MADPKDPEQPRELVALTREHIAEYRREHPPASSLRLRGELPACSDVCAGRPGLFRCATFRATRPGVGGVGSELDGHHLLREHRRLLSGSTSSRVARRAKSEQFGERIAVERPFYETTSWKVRRSAIVWQAIVWQPRTGALTRRKQKGNR